MKVTIICGDPNKISERNELENFYFPEREYLHPKLHTEFIETKILNNDNKNPIIVTNSEHIINRLRIAKKNKEIDNLELYFYSFNEKISIIKIRVDKNGTLSEYPKDFLDEWGNLMFQLL